VLLRTRMTRERVLESLLRDLLTYDADVPADLPTRARDFGFDLGLPRQAIVIEVMAPTGLGSAGSSALRLVREAFQDPQDLSCGLSSSMYVVLRSQHDGRPRLGRDDLLGLTGRIHDLVGATCRVGVGGVAPDERGIATSYSEALMALRVGSSNGLPSPHDIADLRAEQLILSVPPVARARITAETLGDLRSSGDWASTRATVIAWVESGFVLVDAAAALNIHRNTLLYRLGRISKHTGWPTSDRRHWLALYLACLADALGAESSY